MTRIEALSLALARHFEPDPELGISEWWNFASVEGGNFTAFPRPITDPAVFVHILRELLEVNSAVEFMHYSASSYLRIKKNQPFAVTADVCRNKERVQFEGRASSIEEAAAEALCKVLGLEVEA